MAVMDKTLTCSDCETEFIFTARDQEFFTERGFSTPRRCRQCRDQAKVARGDRPSGGGGGAPRQMYDVVCAQCGNPTQVPFNPTSGKPVYCRDCFRR